MATSGSGVTETVTVTINTSGSPDGGMTRTYTLVIEIVWYGFATAPVLAAA